MKRIMLDVQPRYGMVIHPSPDLSEARIMLIHQLGGYRTEWVGIVIAGRAPIYTVGKEINCLFSDHHTWEYVEG